MSLPPPPPASPVGPAATRRRPVGWIVAVAVLSVALLASLVALVRTRQDLDDQRGRTASLQERVDAQQRALDELQAELDGGGDRGGLLDELLRGLLGGAEGDGGPGDALRRLLDQLLGGGSGENGSGGEDGSGGGLGERGSGLEGVDPSCILGGDGLAGIIGGFDPSNRITGTPDEQVAQIARAVEETRELSFPEPPEATFLPATEFDRRVADTVRTQYPAEDAERDSRLLGLLGAIPKGTDLLELQAELLAGQVAGFYDPDTGEIVVRVPDGGGTLDSQGQITLAHELAHALTDEVLGLPDTTEEGDSDGNLARLALVEGDATLLMQRFALRHVPLTDQIGSALSPDLQAAQDELDDQPYFLREQLLFPYLRGLAYTCGLVQDGGWGAVDAAYGDPPATTAAVLFGRPGAPAEVAEPRTPGGTWQVARTDTLGAAQLLWLLEAPGGDTARAVGDPEAAARTWAGDRLLFATDGDRSAVGLSFVTEGNGRALCAALDEWYGAAFPGPRTERGNETAFAGDGQSAVLRCTGPRIALGIGPDAATAEALLP
jgi:hypothetical protein